MEFRTPQLWRTGPALFAITVTVVSAASLYIIGDSPNSRMAPLATVATVITLPGWLVGMGVFALVGGSLHGGGPYWVLYTTTVIADLAFYYLLAVVVVDFVRRRKVS